jgi:NADH:ubiquinone oxidoreductase subunit E/ferredoxin
MIFIPVAIISLILLVITILLAIADRLLVNYGECKITIHQEDEEKQFAVQGGGYLLADLTNNGIKVNSSCGGKATCGYCKVRVLSGGGELLPTEEIFMSREEKLGNMRLACQVKVKNDIEIYIPDFLTIVRNIVKNKTYDPKLRWRWTREGEQAAIIPITRKTKIKITDEDEAKVTRIIEEHADMRGSLVPVLQEINKTFNYLPESALRLTAEKLDIPVSRLFRVATFYNAFSLEPKGRNILRVCMGTSCYVKGGQRILETAERKLGIEVGHHTGDFKFSLEIVSCIGCCGQSPVISVNDDIYGYFKPEMLDDVLHKYDREELEDAKTQARRSG